MYTTQLDSVSSPLNHIVDNREQGS